MVPRTKLHSALLELDAVQAERASGLSKVEDLTSQLGMAWEQLKASTAEAAEMRSALSVMVSRSELMDSEARYNSIHAQMMSSTRKHCEAMDEVENRVITLESEKSKLLSEIKVNISH
jgi:hypothetical protein